MRILVTGFEPFLDEKVNPTQLIADHVNSCASHARRGWESLDVRGLVLPVLFDGAFERLEQERQMFQPHAVLSFGLAGGRSTIDVEHIAVNFRGGGQTLRGDNGGRTESGVIDSAAPRALWTTLPSVEILRDFESAGVSARASFSAGTYVCNDLFFRMQNRLRFTRVQSGFVHVPRLVADGGKASPEAWSWPMFERAVDSILTTFASLGD